MSFYTKLVRDKIPQILDESGVVYETWTATEEEYKAELIKKLIEETEEFSVDGSAEELADVLEVILALKALPEYVGVEAVRQAKLEERGGFLQKVMLQGEK